MTSLPCISLNRYAQERAKKRHPWVFSNEIGDPKRFQRLEPGSLVDVLDCHGDYLGTGFVNPKSLIAVRILSRRRGEEIGAEFFTRKIREAVSLRESLYGKNTDSAGTYRAVFGEADALPGLIVDRFQGAWVVEPHALGMFQRKSEIVAALRELAGGDAIVFRSDHRAADLEGMPREMEIAAGTLPKEGVFAVEGGLRFPVDPLGGQKTGFFFDQRENRRFFASCVAGTPGVTVVDTFCHLGAWGLRALKAGATHCTFVDSSGPALAAVRDAAKAAGLLDRAAFVESDALAFLRAQKTASVGAVALDPPALIPSKKSVPAGSKLYLELNSEALRITKAGGMLSTSTCSYHLHEERFEEIVARAVLVSERHARVVNRGGLSADHPFLPGMEEGRYLKNLCLLVS